MSYIDYLKNKYTIFDVANKLGIQVTGTNGTRATHCISGTHPDKNPSMVFLSQVNRFECKSCGFKGDIFDMIQKVQGAIDNAAAAEWLEPGITRQQTYKSTAQQVNPGQYLASRGITKATAEKFNLALGKQFGKDVLIIPLPNGKNKYRVIGSTKGQRFMQDPGSTACLFTTGDFENAKKVIGCEGELDAIRTWQETGYPCFSSSTGCETFLPEWKERFTNKTVCFAYDNDSAGKNGVIKAAEIIGFDKCKQIEVPASVGKDLTDYFMSGKTKTDFDELLKTSRLVNKNTFLDKLNKEREENKKEIFKTGFSSIDAIIKGVRTGGVYCFAGYQKSGKTSLLLQIVQNILNDNIKVSYTDTELDAQQIAIRFATIYNNLSEDKTTEQIEQDESLQSQWAGMFEDSFFYTSTKDPDFYEKNNLSLDLILEKMRNDIAKGCKVVVMDNVTTLMTKNLGSKNGWEVSNDFISKLIDLANQNEVTVIFVLHTKDTVSYKETPDGMRNAIKNNQAEKIFEESIKLNLRPTSADVYGGALARSQTSGMFLLWRPFQDLTESYLQEHTMLILEGFRHAPSGNTTRFVFHGNKQLFTEVDTQAEQLTKTYAPMQQNEKPQVNALHLTDEDREFITEIAKTQGVTTEKAIKIYEQQQKAAARKLIQKKIDKSMKEREEKHEHGQIEKEKVNTDTEKKEAVKQQVLKLPNDNTDNQSKTITAPSPAEITPAISQLESLPVSESKDEIDEKGSFTEFN